MLKRYPGLIKFANSDTMVLKKLKKAVKYAYGSPFYRNKLKEAGVEPDRIRSVKDFRKMVPLTRREELVEADPYDMLAVEPGKKCLIYSQTSGSTGGHVPIWVTGDELERSVEMAYCLPVFQKLMSPEDRVALCYPYTRTLAGRTADLINQKAGVTIIPMGTRNNLYPPDVVAETLLRLRPTILGAAASDAFSYANILMDQGKDPRKLGIRLIISGAEPCADNRAKVLGNLYGAKVLSLLGQNEVGMAIPCEMNVLHLPSFVMFTEIYRDDGSEALPGEKANSVVTPTWREAQPILRYETGDVIRILEEPCSCGLELPTIEILGRRRTSLNISGREIYPIEMEDILYRSGLNGVWYKILVDGDSIKVVAEHRDRGDYDELGDEISTNFENELKIRTETELVPPGSLYDYRSIREGKPLSRVINNVSGGKQIIEGA
jgi:phenylacetate-CoA ligase